MTDTRKGARPNPSRPKKGVKKVQRSQTPRITESDIVNIVKMYHVEKLSHGVIAAKFGCSRQRISKLIKEHETLPTPSGVMVLYNPSEVMGRSKTMDVFARAKKLSEDTLQVCEISMDLIKHELTCLSKALDGGGSLKQQGIDTERFIDKLTKFFQAAAPYSIERKDGKTTPDATPDNQLHKLMNKRLDQPKAN